MRGRRKDSIISLLFGISVFIFSVAKLCWSGPLIELKEISRFCSLLFLLISSVVFTIHILIVQSCFQIKINSSRSNARKARS